MRTTILRAGWGLADQSLSSVTNFTLGILAARELGLESFGIFSIAFATYSLVLGASRSISSEPFVVRYSHTADADISQPTSRSAGTALATGLLGGIGSLVVSLVLIGDLRGTFVALAIVLPGLMLQDYWRFWFFARGRGAGAFLNDLVWAVALVLGLLLGIANDFLTSQSFILIWGISGGIATLAGLAQVAVIPRPSQSMAWLREQRDLAPRFFGEFVGSNGLSQVAIYLIGAVAGFATVGTLRAAQMLLGPLNVLFQGIRLFSVPEAVRTAREGPTRLLRVGLTLSGVLFVGAVVWGLVIVWLPEEFGVWLLKDSWSAAREVVSVLAFAAAASGAAVGAWVGLRGLAAAFASLRAQWLAGLLIVIGSVTGAFIADAQGAAFGIAAAAWMGTALWWSYFQRESRASSYPETGGDRTVETPT